MAQIGAFESSNGKTDLLSEEEIQADLAAFDAQMDRYYAKDNGCRQSYKDINKQLLCETAKDEVYYLADGGMLDCTFQYVKISEDGQTASVKAIYLG